MLLSFVHDELGWTIGDVLYTLFNHGDDVCRELKHASSVASFLQGGTKHTAAEIINLWMTHPDGRVSSNHVEHDKMYSTCVADFRQAKSVRVALTCFAAQTVMRQLVKEAEIAITPQNGLHASRRKRRMDPDSAGSVKVQWADIGAATLPRTVSTIKRFQPLLWVLLLAVAERGNERGNGPAMMSEAQQEVTSRKHRPAELVSVLLDM